MTDEPKTYEYPACRASRRSVEDAYFEGYLAGAIEIVLSELPSSVGQLKFCLPHEIMVARVMQKLNNSLAARSNGHG